MSSGFAASDETYKTVTRLSHVFEVDRKELVRRMVEFVSERENEFAQEWFERTPK